MSEILRTMRWSTSLWGVVLAAGSLVGFACSGGPSETNSTNETSDCEEGSEGCACLEDGICDPGLVCLDADRREAMVAVIDDNARNGGDLGPRLEPGLWPVHESDDLRAPPTAGEMPRDLAAEVAVRAGDEHSFRR